MNFGTPVPLLLGIFLIVGAVLLFFLDKVRPGYQRDSDKVYAVLFLLSGIFLLGQLTMELIPSFQQILMVGMLTSLMIQNVTSRSPGGDRYSRQPAPDAPSGRDSYRNSRPAYGPSGRANVQAELDRRDIPPGSRYPRPSLRPYEEPMARPDSRSDYGPPDDYRDYPERSPEDEPSEGRDPRVGQPYYSETPRSDMRLRRRRPTKFRGEVSDRYRLGPSDPNR